MFVSSVDGSSRRCVYGEYLKNIARVCRVDLCVVLQEPRMLWMVPDSEYTMIIVCSQLSVKLDPRLLMQLNYH